MGNRTTNTLWQDMENCARHRKRQTLKEASNKNISCREIVNNLQLKESAEKVRRVLNESSNIKFKEMLKQPPLSIKSIKRTDYNEQSISLSYLLLTQ